MTTNRIRNQAARHEDVREDGGIALRILTPPLNGGEWSTSRTGRFTSGERTPCTGWIGGWVGPRDGLNAVGFWASLLALLKFRVLMPQT